MILLKLLRLAFVLFLLYVVIGIAQQLRAEECPVYTAEQQKLLTMARILGEPYDLDQTLMAITEQESFNCASGKPVCRVNADDGPYGSYGVTQINLMTGLYFLGWPNTPEHRQVLAYLLITTDSLSMDLSLIKLRRHQHKSWFNMVKAYNGAGPMAERYAREVAERLERMERCQAQEQPE